MMLYKNLKDMVLSPNGDTNFFNIVAGVLQGDKLALLGGVCNLVISVDCSLNYSHHKYNTKTLQSRKRNGIEHNEH